MGMKDVLEQVTFNHPDEFRDAFMLKGSLAKEGYDWWWHSFTARNEKTGEEKPFYIEFFTINPELGGDKPVFGQIDQNQSSGRKPSYLMVNVGAWGENAAQAGRDIIKLLNARHRITDPEEGFTYYELSSILSEVSNIVMVVTLLISFIAAIALLVGGIGVMNIMLVTVTERTKEIGIRKALGARTNSILLQFLIESGVIALVGGTIGLIFGYTGSIIICNIIAQMADGLKVAPDFNPLIIAGTMIFSMGIGVFFGVIPARKAAKLTPVDALRHK